MNYEIRVAIGAPAILRLLPGRTHVGGVLHGITKARSSRPVYGSIEQVGEVFLHRIGHIQGPRLNRAGRVHAAAGHEHAAVDDEEIFYVVAAPPAIDDRSFWVVAGACGAEQVPARDA